MKKTLLFAAFLLPAISGISQLNIQSGATFFIQSGATVTVQGDVVANADIQGPGILQMKGTALQNLNLNGFSVQNLQIDNTNNVALGGAALIGTSLLFTGGKLQLNTFDLSIAAAATISGFDNTKYVMTSGTGQLVKLSLGAVAFDFPVGFDATTYNPIAITQNGTAENIGVRVLQNVLLNGTSGSPFIKEVVDASWAVTESAPGANNINMTSTWNGTDEMTGFNRTKTGISYYDGIGWDMLNINTGASAGGGPYTITRAGITSLASGGIFAVGTRPVLTQLLVSPRIYLQGTTYTPGAPGLMSDGIRSSGVLSTFASTEPYTGLSNFTHSGSGGGETVTGGIFGATGVPANDIVDWVFAELRHSGTGAVITTRALLIQRDGDIVDIDPTNPAGAVLGHINFAGEPAGSYYVAIRHRNSLSVRTTNAFPSLSRTVTTPYDFTTSLSQAIGGAPQDQMATVSPGVFGLWGGNSNSDAFTRRVGSAGINDYSLFLSYLGLNSIVSGVYRREDFNMDGTVRKTGSAGVNDYSKLLSILGTITIITQATY